jgi:hypothetical protein
LDHKTKEKLDSYSLSDIWPIFDNSKYKSEGGKLKSPTFRSYIFRQSPPTDVTDYLPIVVPLNLNCYDGNSKSYSYHYSPVHNPPIWPSSEKSFKELKTTEEKTADKLTVDSAPKCSFPLFDFSGDFFLKFIVLECYGTFLNFLINYSAVLCRRINNHIFINFNNFVNNNRAMQKHHLYFDN